MWSAGAASAHAVLVSTDPGPGAHVDTSPAELRLQLDEPVTLVAESAQLIDSGGKRFALSGTRLDDGQRRVVLVPAAPVPDGAYLATARVVSADTHVVSLSIQFTVGTVTAPGHFADRSSPGIEHYLDSPTRGLTYLGLILSAGLYAAACWVRPSVVRRRRFQVVYRVGNAVFSAGFVFRFFVLVAQQSGGPSDISGASARTVLDSPHGAVAAVAVLASIVAVAVVSRGSRSAVAAGVLQAVAAVLAVTLDGHGGSAQGWPWLFTGTLLHVYDITAWLGGVVVVAFVLRGVRDPARWHAVAVGHVAAAVAGGTVLAVLQVQPLEALLHTIYGLVLTVKAIVAAGVVALGYLSSRWFRRTGAIAGRPRTVVLETVLAVVVLAVTSVLATLAPAKDTYTTDIATTLDFGAAQVLHIGIDSIRHGPQRLTVDYPPAKLPVAQHVSATVSVDLSSESANVARLPVTLGRPVVDNGALVWRSDQLVVPAPGNWKVTVRFDDGTGPKLASFYYWVL
ncbi:copper resistance CopC/CopD family protein [Nocardia nova]|uniref:copper resistance CopC/CopD family protein n=1 Tax=Nocardia nova TaxID=37330 RepID=UPI0021581EC9|nr:copper resistance protein CopC [Nocardia nova]